MRNHVRTFQNGRRDRHARFSADFANLKINSGLVRASKCIESPKLSGSPTSFAVESAGIRVASSRFVATPIARTRSWAVLRSVRTMNFRFLHLAEKYLWCGRFGVNGLRQGQAHFFVLKLAVILAP